MIKDKTQKNIPISIAELIFCRKYFIKRYFISKLNKYEKNCKFPYKITKINDGQNVKLIIFLEILYFLMKKYAAFKTKNTIIVIRMTGIVEITLT